MKLKKFFGVLMTVLLLINIFFPVRAQCITIKEEEELGREFMKVITRQFRFIQDPFITDYIENMGNKILSVMPPQAFKYRFFIISQDVYNAFAGPGGIICINRGLIEAMDSEDELAGIMAHEITHVSSRHISHKIDRSAKMNLAALAGLVAGIFLGVSGGGDAGSAMSIGSMAAVQSAALSYSRQDEMQADELGIKYLTGAGYDGEGMLIILKKIRENQWFGSNQIPDYIMTHPAVDARIAYLDTWIEGHKKALPGNSKKKDNTFKKIKTRLISAYGDKSAALKKMKNAVLENPEDPLANHGYGIALARNDRAKEGVVYVKKALEKYPFDPYMLKDMGEIYFIDGQYQNALQALKGSAGIAPDDFETLYLLGRTYLELEDFESASQSLEKLLEKRPKYPGALYYLGSAYGKQGKLDKAHYYLAIYYKNKGDFKNSIFHVKQVIKYSKDKAQKEEAEKILEDAKKERTKERPEPINKPG
ncbi:Peptidase, M48 family [Desulfonema limicola]|uniref:Peptidase, M48 family n=1 Tax=Desulfonema limicola TaxID=45656 RepID=A0A975BES2_9BACT|nr:M48 family metallopeptidase [Desulfonema limicola]QTA83978.1 Peptidase, M48 family [Desulfonema limicola]